MEKSENGRISQRRGWADDPQYPHANSSTWKKKVFVGEKRYVKPKPFHITSGNQDCYKNYWYSEHDCTVRLAGLS